MNKNQELVEKFLNGDLEGTKLFAAFNGDCEGAIMAADARREDEEGRLQELYQKYGRDTVASSERTGPADDYIRAKNHAEKQCKDLKMDYTKACSIVIEGGVLHCKVPLRTQIRGSRASIKLPGLRFILQEVEIAIPKEYIGKDPLKCEAFAGWIIRTMIMEGNCFVWAVLQEEGNN